MMTIYNTTTKKIEEFTIINLTTKEDMTLEWLDNEGELENPTIQRAEDIYEETDDWDAYEAAKEAGYEELGYAYETDGKTIKKAQDMIKELAELEEMRKKFLAAEKKFNKKYGEDMSEWLTND